MLDRWALSEAHRLTRGVDEALEAFDTQRAGRLVSAFVDDLSNWYVRRSRRRFWDGDPGALATLHECLRRVTLVMAPLTPFVTEQVWQDLVVSTEPGAPDSVHLASWPEVDDTVVDEALATDMALVRRLVELGRAARAGSSVRTRQPLPRALVAATGWAGLSDALRAEVAEELNVVELVALDGGGGDLVDVTVKANFRALGKRFGKRTPEVAAAVAAADAEAFLAALRTDGAAVVEVGDETVSVTADEVLVTESPREGWSVESAAGETVALDLTLTPALRRAGLAREVVRAVQEARKAAGLEVSDRIEVAWASEQPETVAAVEEHAAAIAAEVLATGFARVAGSGRPAEDPGAPGSVAELGLTFTLRRAAPGPAH